MMQTTRSASYRTINLFACHITRRLSPASRKLFQAAEFVRLQQKSQLWVWSRQVGADFSSGLVGGGKNKFLFTITAIRLLPFAPLSSSANSW
jgi:hypothetical protein